MRILVFDPFHGAAGDMITAALLDCGADRECVVSAMRAVVAEPTVETVTRAGIQATKVHTRATPDTGRFPRFTSGSMMPPRRASRSICDGRPVFCGSTRLKKKSTGPASISTKSGPTMPLLT